MENIFWKISRNAKLQVTNRSRHAMGGTEPPPTKKYTSKKPSPHPIIKIFNPPGCDGLNKINLNIDLNTQNQWANDPKIRNVQTYTKWSCDVYWKRYARLFFSKKLRKYQNILAFKYCIIEFVWVFQVTKSLVRTGIFVLNNLSSLSC